MNSMRDHLVHSLEWARQCTLDMLKGFPTEQITARPGDADNHALWILGHLAVSDEWILTMLTGDPSPLPESYGTLFGHESAVRSDPRAYPEFDEVKAGFDSSRQHLMAWLESQSDEQLEQPIDDGGIDFAKNAREAISKEAWHEGWHAGQLSTVRRGLGLQPAFG